MNQDDLVGLVIDNKYRLDRKIGEGGMGAVYLSTQLMVDRNVAIKVLHAGYNGHEKLKQRFEVEAKAIGRLHHPHCITLFDFGYSQEMQAFYTVMEYLDGEALHKRLGKGVSPREAVMIVRQIALGLDHAHHQGILHRDLKPENIMLAKMTDGSELVKVLDFGIARVFQSGSADSSQEVSNNRLTRAGEIFGTPAYISPEQARGERDLSPASDIYSLGVMLFELLEGRLPYWGESPIDTIMMHIRDPVPNISRLDVPGPIKALVTQLLSKDPSQRPQSGKRVAELIDQAVMEGAMSQMPVNMFSADTGMHGAMPVSALSAEARRDLGIEAPAPKPQQSQQSHQRTLLDIRPDLGSADEWEETPATKISTPPQPIHNTMPPMHAAPVGFGPPAGFGLQTPSGPQVGFGPQAASGPQVGFGAPNAPRGSHGNARIASSAGRPEPKLVALDYEAVRPSQRRRRWIFPAVVALLMVIAGGIGGLGYLNIMAEEAERARKDAEAAAAAPPEEPTTEIAPDTAIKTPPPPSDDPVEAPAEPDGAKPDAAKPDAAKPDAAKPDAAKPDAAKPEVKPTEKTGDKPAPNAAIDAPEDKPKKQVKKTPKKPKDNERPKSVNLPNTISPW